MWAGSTRSQRCHTCIFCWYKINQSRGDIKPWHLLWALTAQPGHLGRRRHGALLAAGGRDMVTLHSSTSKVPQLTWQYQKLSAGSNRSQTIQYIRDINLGRRRHGALLAAGGRGLVTLLPVKFPNWVDNTRSPTDLRDATDDPKI